MLRHEKPWKKLDNDEIVEHVCELLSEGHSLRKICERKGMPERRTVHRWLAQHDEFRHQYARARIASRLSL
jgi:predicted secreted protein